MIEMQRLILTPNLFKLRIMKWKSGHEWFDNPFETGIEILQADLAVCEERKQSCLNGSMKLKIAKSRQLFGK